MKHIFSNIKISRLTRSAILWANLLILGHSSAGEAARTALDSSGADWLWGFPTLFNGKTQGLMCAWIKVTSWTWPWEAFYAYDNFTTQDAGWGFQRKNSNDEIIFFTRGSGTETAISCGTNFAGQGWFNVCGYIDTGTPTMRCYRNGGFQEASTIVRNPFGTVTEREFEAVAPSNNFAIAEVVAWTDLTQTQAETAIMPALSNGVNPMRMPFIPAFYAPMWGTTGTETDLSGKGIGTAPADANGAVTNHCPCGPLKK